MAKTHEVLTAIAAGTKVKPVYAHNNEQKEKLNALKEVCLFAVTRNISIDLGFLGITLSQHALNLVLPETDPYHEWELRWLNQPDTIPRYMRAAKWNLEDAKKRIEGTIHWRRDFKPDLIPPEEVSCSIAHEVV